jgi:ferredoxin-nitrite reductase
MANQFERLKSEKDGLAVKAELEAFARMGWENIRKLPGSDR